VDLIAGIKAVKVLGLVEIPEHGGAILAARGAERTVRGDSDSVYIPIVSGMVGLDTARRKLPNLFTPLVARPKIKVGRAIGRKYIMGKSVISALVIVCLIDF